MATRPQTFRGQQERSPWSNADHEFAKKARALNALKLDRHVKALMAQTGRSQRDCTLLVHSYLREDAQLRRWSEEEVERVRELLVSHSVEEAARKVGRSIAAVRSLCKRQAISLRELRCDLFTVDSLAAVMGVRRAEILYWIEQGWLQAQQAAGSIGSGRRVTPEALQRCLRLYRDQLAKRNVRSTRMLKVFEEYCYVPKHTEGEQLLQVREAKREHSAFLAAKASFARE